VRFSNLVFACSDTDFILTNDCSIFYHAPKFETKRVVSVSAGIAYQNLATSDTLDSPDIGEIDQWLQAVARYWKLQMGFIR